MNWDLSEREAQKIIEYRMSREWLDKHKRFTLFCFWWIVVVGTAVCALVFIFRAEIKAWVPSQSLGIGLPVFVAFAWPIVVAYAQSIHWMREAKRRAMMLYLPKRVEVQ